MIAEPLGDQTILVIQRGEGVTADPLGIPAADERTTAQPGCSVQPKYSTEVIADTDFTRTVWVVYAPPTPLILALKAIDEIGYLGERYAVHGDPTPWTGEDGAVDHVRFHLRRSRG
ncbi:hypothetical protein F5X71_34615 [Nocardia brasiliensis]|uniref:Head-to-tail stopper n=1 Tax=Nocardia brasiliensis TaxID=37326 RepID=A0A6G9Y0W7_NOCBR|nr:hypothetical protein [Nocardia brasiliensis]QIS06760.1 hypothetical protein F5X71_34615 [Nocardia brasiliensis]